MEVIIFRCYGEIDKFLITPDHCKLIKIIVANIQMSLSIRNDGIRALSYISVHVNEKLMTESNASIYGTDLWN